MSSIATTRARDARANYPGAISTSSLSNPRTPRTADRRQLDASAIHREDSNNPFKAPPPREKTIPSFLSGLFAKVPNLLLKTPGLDQFTLKYLMQWILRDPNAENFNPEIFKSRGYTVEKIPNNKLIQGDKFLILPHKISQEPVVIIHGARTTARSLGGSTQAALNRGHPVIIGDIAGFGSNNEKFNTNRIIDDIKGLFDFTHQRFNQAFSVFAHSYGTHNAAEALKKLFKEKPEARIDKLILVSPWSNLYEIANELWEPDASGRRKIENITKSDRLDSYTKSLMQSIDRDRLELLKNFANTEAVFADIASQGNQTNIGKIFITYGKDDEHVRQEFSEKLAAKLREMGFNVKDDALPNPLADHYVLTGKDIPSTTKTANWIFATAA